RQHVLDGAEVVDALHPPVAAGGRDQPVTGIAGHGREMLVAHDLADADDGEVDGWHGAVSMECHGMARTHAPPADDCLVATPAGAVRRTRASRPPRPEPGRGPDRRSDTGCHAGTPCPGAGSLPGTRAGSARRGNPAAPGTARAPAPDAGGPAPGHRRAAVRARRSPGASPPRCAANTGPRRTRARAAAPGSGRSRRRRAVADARRRNVGPGSRACGSRTACRPPARRPPAGSVRPTPAGTGRPAPAAPAPRPAPPDRRRG